VKTAIAISLWFVLCIALGKWQRAAQAAGHMEGDMKNDKTTVIWDGPKYARRAIFWAWVFAIICALIAGFLVGTARAAAFDDRPVMHVIGTLAAPGALSLSQGERRE
jgi:hypothetical protein